MVSTLYYYHYIGLYFTIRTYRTWSDMFSTYSSSAAYTRTSNIRRDSSWSAVYSTLSTGTFPKVDLSSRRTCSMYIHIIGRRCHWCHRFRRRCSTNRRVFECHAAYPDSRRSF